MTGAGLKKCSPRMRPGWSVRSAMAATESALVFVARMTSGGAPASSMRKIVPLGREVLEGGLDDERRTSAARSGEAGAGAEPVETAVDPGVDRVRIELDARRPTGEALAHADRGPAANAAGSTSWSANVMPGLEGELGDPRAHRPGADDADPFEVRHVQIGLMASNGWRHSRQ